MNIGVVVHGPEVVDSGYADIILNLLKEYGNVKARLGGTMGRTAVLDAELEDIIDISKKRLPSESVDKFAEEGFDAIFLINYGKSDITGHSFGFKVFRRCKKNPNLIQIERPGESDGTIIPWTASLRPFADKLSRKLNLKVINHEKIRAKMISNQFIESSFDGVYDASNDKVDGINKASNNNAINHKKTRIYRKIAGVSLDENIFVNGIVIGRSTSEKLTLVVEDGVIVEIIGGNLKKHGVSKLGKIDIENAIIKTGLLRRAIVTPRILKLQKRNKKFNVSYLDHAAEDIYKFKDVDLVVTVGDDTTLVAADILYRFKVPIIGITDGDIDKVVENGFKSKGSMIIELEAGCDDLIGEKIFSKLFNGKETIEIENIENFKKEILQIINKSGTQYIIKDNY